MNDVSFTHEIIPLIEDYEGKVIATLISSNRNTGNRPAVLYLHGFIDYFFHPHVADAFLTKGYDFYALELRKCGNSLLPHQHPNYCRNVEEYFEELDIAIRLIYKKSNTPITLLGHSTGGLIASLYLNTGKERNLVNKLILNSPFLEFNIQSKTARFLGKVIAGPISKLFPYAKINNAVNPIYPISLHKDYEGEWNFNLKFKPIEGFPAYYSWIHAIDIAQKKLRETSEIQVPILLLHSSKSFIPKKITPEVHLADIVLDIKDIITFGPSLGRFVILKQIENAKHDIFLSQKEVRENVFRIMFDWLNGI